MTDVERRQLLDRRVALDGDAKLRALFEPVSLEGLQHALESAEIGKRATARYGRLGAIWRDGGNEIIDPAELVDDQDAA